MASRDDMIDDLPGMDDAPRPSAHRSVQERAATGKAVRATAPRGSHGEFTARARTRAVELLEEQEANRVAELLPIRHQRMAASAFSFYRGAAAVMATDLADLPRTGLDVQLCGDAHLANFGGFASPERSMVFDINDFDETLPGPFEWDVKRLAASLEIAGRARGFTAKQRTSAVKGSVRSYREAMRTFSRMQNLDVWYSRLSADDIEARWGDALGPGGLKGLQKGVDRARSKDRLRAEAKLTELVDGEPRFRSDPPLLVPVDELMSSHEAQHLEDAIHQALQAYRRTLPDDRRRLLESYRFVQLARKVVGVGSVGTRCWVALLVGLDDGDPLFLQVKEAEPSVLEHHLESSDYPNHGQRVVEGQRLMQASSDIFLGWERSDGVDGQSHDYYFRQLWDWKASADLETMTPSLLHVYGQMCGWTLARAHARSGDRVAIAAYLGRSPSFDDAIARFSSSYADQNELDHRALESAIAAGRVSSAGET